MTIRSVRVDPRRFRVDPPKVSGRSPEGFGSSTRRFRVVHPKVSGRPPEGFGSSTRRFRVVHPKVSGRPPEGFGSSTRNRAHAGRQRERSSGAPEPDISRRLPRRLRRGERLLDRIRIPSRFKRLRSATAFAASWSLIASRVLSGAELRARQGARRRETHARASPPREPLPCEALVRAERPTRPGCPPRAARPSFGEARDHPDRRPRRASRASHEAAEK